MAGEKREERMCNLCRYEESPHKQDAEPLSMESKLKSLRVLTGRMTGNYLDGLSFAELVSLEGRLQDAFDIVKNLTSRVELEEAERMPKQKKKESVMRKWPLVPCKFSRTSSEERSQKQKQDDEAPVSALQREFEKRLAAPMESEYERLCLLNERLNARNLDGMTHFELIVLKGRISRGLNMVKHHMLGPRTDQIAWQRREESLALFAEKESRSLRARARPPRRHALLSASRKFRRCRLKTIL